MYLTIKQKFIISVSLSALWAVISYFAALPWIDQLSELTNYTLAMLIIFGIAIIPGAMHAFLIFSPSPLENTNWISINIQDLFVSLF